MQTIIILDFGSQYTQLIARAIRDMNVYCEIHPYNKVPQLDDQIKGVILSGSPFSCNDSDAPIPDLQSIRGKIPLLAICYGAQFLAKNGGGTVTPSKIREYGRANLSYIKKDCLLTKNMQEGSQVWMSHGDTIENVPSGYTVICSTPEVTYAGFEIQGEPTWGIQFHPEVTHSVQGDLLIKNFIFDICKCKPTYTSDNFVQSSINRLREQLQDDKVILGLSGGVDSTVAAFLLHQAIGSNLHCIFVDNGLLRYNEYEDVLASYKGMGLNIKGIDAKDIFYSVLNGVTDPEQKRKAIGKTFIDVFDKESQQIKDAKWLGQGTIYPDVIESVSIKGPSATIKSHHNVGGLPEYMKLKIVEPLRTLFKDEVRKVGKAMGLPAHLLGRHPFPGPGLAIRILGEVTPEKIEIIQKVDHIFIHNLKEDHLYDKVWQAGAILLPVQSVGVMGDERTYENVVALRAVESTDGMTADWVHLPYEFLAKVSNEIINKVKGVNRVVYDISSKPPATIEWE